MSLIRRTTDVGRQVAYYERLQGLVDFFAAWYVLAFDDSAAAAFQRQRQQRVRIGTMDLKIASIALEHNATLLSGNLQDFHQVAGIHVENWLQI